MRSKLQNPELAKPRPVTTVSRVLVIISVCLCLAFGAWSYLRYFGTPFEFNGHAALEQIIQDNSEGLVRVVSFKKTDGLTQEVMGVKYYTLMFRAEIEFTDNCFWAGDNSVRAIRPSDRTTIVLMAAYNYERKKGQREYIVSELRFRKTENGWSVAK